jgi:topoisomerase-4 subunit B
LGEISPDEFGAFIGEQIHLEPVLIQDDTSIDKVLEYYMGKNTQERQDFIIDNLRFEVDVIEENCYLFGASRSLKDYEWKETGLGRGSRY